MYIFIILLFILIISAITILENKLDNKKIINENLEQSPQAESEINYNDYYIKKDYLLTTNELKFYKLLKQITDKLGYSLFCQVSLYQILRNKSYKDFNKIKSKSIDFVITEKNCKILLCIELDDASHEKEKRIERDNFIQKLFEDLEIKLLRIPVQSFYNMDELETKIKESL